MRQLRYTKILEISRSGFRSENFQFLFYNQQPPEEEEEEQEDEE